MLDQFSEGESVDASDEERPAKKDEEGVLFGESDKENDSEDDFMV